MKSYMMTINTGSETIRVGVDVKAEHRNLAYHILSAACHSSIWGFGDAKAVKLDNIIDDGGVMEFTYQGTKTKITVEVV